MPFLDDQTKVSFVFLCLGVNAAHWIIQLVKRNNPVLYNFLPKQLGSIRGPKSKNEKEDVDRVCLCCGSFGHFVNNRRSKDRLF